MLLDDALTRLELLIEEVRKASLIDEKTGLGSAMALTRDSRLIGDGQSGFDVVAFCDLNDFKHLNDIHGHDVGDVALNKVGEAIRGNVIGGLNCKAYRPSGDEFVMLLRSSSIEAFLASYSDFSTITFTHNEIQLSTSIGVGYVRSDGKTRFDELLQRAEIACQHAKTSQGRKLVEWTEEIKANPLVRLTGICGKCGSRTTCNISKENAPEVLSICPCCSNPFKEV